MSCVFPSVGIAWHAGCTPHFMFGKLALHWRRATCQECHTSLNGGGVRGCRFVKVLVHHVPFLAKDACLGGAARVSMFRHGPCASTTGSDAKNRSQSDGSATKHQRHRVRIEASCTLYDRPEYLITTSRQRRSRWANVSRAFARCLRNVSRHR